MHILKSLQFYFISLLLIIIIPPLHNLPQETSNATVIETLQLSPQMIDQESKKINLLFSFDPTEKNSLKQVLTQFDPSYLHFYRNFPIGFITIQDETLRTIQKKYPEIYSRFHISQKFGVIPSLEQFRPQMVSESQQSSYIPPSDVINADQLWNKGIDGSNVEIAIIDSGIDGSPSHGDFMGRIIYEESFINATYGYSSDSEEDTQDYHGHGTHVAGIAAGAGSSYRGIAYNANLLNLKAADKSGSSTKEAMLAAIDEAITQDVDVISISIGFGKSSPWGSGDELTLAVDSAVDAGISVVVAAGNEGSEDEMASIGSPASARKAITVGATNGSFNIASFSSRGPSFGYKVDPDIVAPGVQIIAPLAPGCLIELAYESLVGIELGDYMILSGTSMAAPVVSGAVALLKQEYPEATPSAIRAALQESAVNIDESLYTQGSGLVNVEEASALLELTEHSEGFDLISSLPRAIIDRPVEFAERLAFPGDHTQMSISFATGRAGIITFRISESIENFVEFNITEEEQMNSGYFEKSLNFTIPLNTAPGTYKGNISYDFLSETYEIPLVFTISNPNSKIYWDTHYTGKDDSPFFNYRALDDFLVSKSQFDMDEYEKALTWENLSQNDILVLTDLEYPISEKELSFISEFHNKNGSILLVTSAFPYFNPDPYTRVSKALGIPVNFTDRVDLVNYTDNGRSRDLLPLSPQEVEISWESDNPLFEGVNQIPLKIGTAFKGDSSLKHQAQVITQSYLVVAAYEPSNKGKVLILGSELWLYSSFLSTNDGQNFTNNVFNWLKPDTGITVNSRISSSDRQLEVSAYYYNNLPISVEIDFSNGSLPLENPLLYNATLQHHRMVVTLGEKQNQKISVTIKNGSKNLKEFDLFDINTLPEVIDIQINFSATPSMTLPSWADEDNKYFTDQGINISLTHSVSNSVKSILMISNQFEDTLGVIVPPLDTMDQIVIETELLNVSNTQQSLNWTVPENFPTGYYSYEIQVWVEIEKNFTVLLRTDQGSFFIPDPEPTLNIKSSIGGKNLDFYRDIETSAGVPIWKPGETIELRLIGQDNNSNEFKVHVQLLHYYLWFVDRTVLDYYEIQSSENKSENIGNFTVPKNPIPIPDDVYELEINNQLYILLIFIRDTQGNYDIEVIFFIISSSLQFDIDPFFLLIFGFLAILIMISVAITIRKRGSTRKLPYSIENTYPRIYDPSTPEKHVIVRKFCHNCGTTVVPEAKFCSICGIQLSLGYSQE
ncbi:MAG: S8 family serine peptidase [Candidatus Hodarchaeales archaeon]|jgi:subtilisin family serine protease